MAWELSLAGVVGMVLGLVVRGLSKVVSLAVGCLGRGGVLAPEGPRPPLVWAWGFFPWFIQLALVFGLLSKKYKNKVELQIDAGIMCKICTGIAN